MYVGDLTPGKTIYVPFTTNQADGTPITLAGTPAVSIYKGSSTTESTAGVTLTVDFDSRTGSHLVAVDTSADGTFYAAGSEFRLVITAGTVDSVSVVGAVVGGFSLSNRSALRPTVADRTLDVSSGGEAGVDWANVGSPTTTVGLSGTTVKTATDVEADTQDIQTRLPAALVSGRIDASVGAMATGVVTASSIASDAITDAKVAADVTIASVTGAVGSVAAVSSGAITTASFAAGAINAAAIASNAITAAKVATDAIGAAQLAADAVVEIQSGLSTLTAGQVNAEVLDVLTVDTFAEVSGVPAATSTLKDKINWLFALARNKLTSTSTTISLKNDAGSGDVATAAHAESAGTYTRDEWS